MYTCICVRVYAYTASIRRVYACKHTPYTPVGCLQLAGCIYLWCAVSTNNRPPDPYARVNAVATLCSSTLNENTHTQTPCIDMVLVYTHMYMRVYMSTIYAYAYTCMHVYMYMRIHPPPPPTLSKQHLCPSNTRRWFRQFLHR